MKFGPVSLDLAEGAVLAHSMATAKGRLRKGKVLTAKDITALRAEGQAEVTVARLEPVDLPEDEAAARIANALGAGDAVGMTVRTAKTGRANLAAKSAGLIEVDPQTLAALNRIDPGITLATVPQWHRVAAGDLICTVKIIPYAVAKHHVEQAEHLAPGTLRLRPPVFSTATLIETSLGDRRPPDKGRRVLAARLARLGLSLTPRSVVPHRAPDLQQAMLDAPGEVIFVLTVSATSDANDVGPRALTQAGGLLTRFGMPVDPGNLLYLGTLGLKPVIGLPGCARSPALNGADWVMERVLCGVDVTSDDIAAMGLGGLLKEMPSRPRPRES